METYKGIIIVKDDHGAERTHAVIDSLDPVVQQCIYAVYSRAGAFVIQFDHNPVLRPIIDQFLKKTSCVMVPTDEDNWSVWEDPELIDVEITYAEYLQTKEWKAKRIAALKRAGHRCQVCSEFMQPLHVHHNSYKNIGKEEMYDLVVLCETCHKQFHDNRKKAFLNKETYKQQNGIEAD
jgi:hypothetical protein